MNMEQEISALEKIFNEFYVNFNSTKCTSYPDMLVYKVYGLRASEEAKRANELIKQMNLPLIAKTNSTTNGIFNDSIVIKPLNNNENE